MTRGARFSPLPNPPLVARTAQSGAIFEQPLPFGVSVAAVDQEFRRPLLPEWPGAGQSPRKAVQTVPPLAAIPAAAHPTGAAHAPQASPARAGIAESPRDFTDQDLREALAPIFPASGEIGGGQFALPSTDPMLEPLVRAAVRRALAEFSPSPRPFAAPGTAARINWRLQALFTSRTYEEILFEKTHRFQVCEVFLLDVRSLALVSFASSNPARHASVRRVEGTAHRLATQLRNAEGLIRARLELPDERTAVSSVGRALILLAVIRGQPNELLATDLEFALRRIESRFRERLAPGGPPLLHELQPFLEDCLLIQSPAGHA